MPEDPGNSSQHARIMAQSAEAERRGSRVEARAIAHEGVGQRVGGLASGCREEGGRAGLGSARRLLAAALARGRTKHFRGPSGGRVLEC